MIPADLAARLRLLTEASFFETEPPVPGLQRARAIQAQLPDLLPGQRFTAALQRTLPDGTFQAIVAGRQITLALPHSAKAGDTLELVVTHSTPRAVFAQLADAGATGAARPELSPTGRLISFLLTGQPAAEPARLAEGRPLLNTPPANGAVFAPVLRQALAQSGLFYEAQQARWLAGKVDTAALLSQPQGQLGMAGRPLPGGMLPQGGLPGQPATAGTAAGTPQGPASAASTAGTSQTQGAASLTQARAAGAVPAVNGPERSSAQTASQIDNTQPARLAPIPERVLPVVHQQLDALATQQYVWHGQAWPGQHMELSIEDPSEGEGDGSGDGREWHTTLRLSLPRLGGVDAHLYLGAAGLALRLQADDADAAQALLDGRAALEEALEAAGIALTGMAVELRDVSAG
ncbi:flagellar hook-length control protein FliK [Pseudothauera nasutitermitis]|uniref:Flagellar hook-length control protein FliK n=1 Tax=Pseudothauera nasutitermitis TaxID=2565930 RepID=A0A4V3WC40_9RHOO|nr:flagellar hook-length control protein FliK [Pseudothauera nasutitermitis]THF65705.1 flagellar hook-length control protein FliK [Pseudothauera nasutitermitis]